ncbi:MAG: lysophospholipase L1-like esterase [Arenicella sp.]|jgi:lysophospholipase L1-like esterase
MKYKQSPHSVHRRWFYIFVPVVSSIASILLIELSLVVFYPVPASIESNMYFIADEHTGYRLKPNSKGYYQNQIPANANGHGHRDDSVSMKKPKGTYRILVLGDSFTVGANVMQEKVYPQVLENLFRKNNIPSVEVINAGVGGWDPFQYAQYYQYYGHKFSPDLILIGFFVGNDTYAGANNANQTSTAVLGRRVSREARQSNLIKLKVFSYNHSNLARLLLNKGPRKRNFTRRNCNDFSKQYLAIQKQRLQNHLKKSDSTKRHLKNTLSQIARIKKLANQNSTPLKIILIPDENQVNANLQTKLINSQELDSYDFSMPQAVLLENFKNADIPAIDLLPVFKNQKRCLYMNDTHWAAEGHELAAKAIYSALKDQVYAN